MAVYDRQVYTFSVNKSFVLVSETGELNAVSWSQPNIYSQWVEAFHILSARTEQQPGEVAAREATGRRTYKDGLGPRGILLRLMWIAHPEKVKFDRAIPVYQRILCLDGVRRDQLSTGNARRAWHA